MATIYLYFAYSDCPEAYEEVDDAEAEEIGEPRASLLAASALA